MAYRDSMSNRAKEIHDDLVERATEASNELRGMSHAKLRSSQVVGGLAVVAGYIAALEARIGALESTTIL